MKPPNGWQPSHEHLHAPAALPKATKTPAPDPRDLHNRIVLEDDDEPLDTGLYIVDYGDYGGISRYQLHFAFSGETGFDDEHEALAALSEYETIIFNSIEGSRKPT
ncbi:MAG: hypothetical protein E6R03_02535 [Hyphomicrobiaceae bacterium]|nr:MAG: hypothetical protein E6R03_02535 [Hyphomicrobiaceae bacterium]